MAEHGTRSVVAGEIHPKEDVMKKWLMVTLLALGVAVPSVALASTAADGEGGSCCPCCCPGS